MAYVNLGKERSVGIKFPRFRWPTLALVTERMAAARAERALQRAGARLEGLSPHLLADIGLERWPAEAPAKQR